MYVLKTGVIVGETSSGPSAGKLKKYGEETTLNNKKKLFNFI